MKLFVNDKPVNVIEWSGPINSVDFDAIFNGSDDLVSKYLKGNVLVENASTQQVDRLLKLLETKKLKKLVSITIAVTNYTLVKEFIKDQYKIIKASGGVVVKGDKILMIYRLKKWDLPKGKLKKKEDPKLGAKREVEEECNIKVEVKDKLCSTWHTYSRKNRRMVKKTNWYLMNIVDETQMAPQVEEYIEEVKWMTKKEVKKALKNSFRSIEEVCRYYFEDVLKAAPFE